MASAQIFKSLAEMLSMPVALSDGRPHKSRFSTRFGLRNFTIFMTFGMTFYDKIEYVDETR